MLISKLFPSRFLKGSDIVGKEINVTIREVKNEKVFSQQTKKQEVVLVLYFENKEKGIIMKKTRSNDVVQITGSDDTDGWKGKTICMYTEKKSAGGEMHDVIRFKKQAENPDTLPEEDKKNLSKELDLL